MPDYRAGCVVPPVATGRKGTFPIACSINVGFGVGRGMGFEIDICAARFTGAHVCTGSSATGRYASSCRAMSRFAPKANIPLRRFDPMSVHTARSKRRRHIDDAVLVIDRAQFGELGA